ncbi:unnamed protein product, partial [Ectocarpus sp. 12 AP-2014]
MSYHHMQVTTKPSPSPVGPLDTATSHEADIGDLNTRAASGEETNQQRRGRPKLSQG